MLQAENIQIFHHLQYLLTKANLAGLSLSEYKAARSALKNLLLINQVPIYDTYMLLRLC